MDIRLLCSFACVLCYINLQTLYVKLFSGQERKAQTLTMGTLQMMGSDFSLFSAVHAAHPDRKGLGFDAYSFSDSPF